MFRHLWEVELTYRYIFTFKLTLRSQQPDIVPIIFHRCCGKFAVGVVDTGSNFAAGVLVKLVAKFAAGVVNTGGVVDTGGKFATGVVDIGGAPCLANISANFRKNLNGA